VGLLPPPANPSPPSVEQSLAPSVKAWPGQISQAGPMLPGVAPQVPRPTSVQGNPFGTSLYSSDAPRPRKTSRANNGVRRAMSWLLLLAMLGGIGFAGAVYGPEFVESFDSDATNGPDAPLVYPMPVSAAPAVRTATFTVSEPDPFGGTQNYEVTADFESGVARVVIPRTDSPNIEMLTLWDQAFIRRIDEPTWYALPRGDFPIDFSLGRGRWVHTLDELLPPAVRQFSTITEATDSSVGAVPARRLVVSVDPARLLQAQTAATTPTVDGSPPASLPLPPGITVQAGINGVEVLAMEIWVDDTGIVRKAVLPPELGGETITVTSVSPDAWDAMFPTPAEVQPLTAEVLFRLGL